MGLLGIVNALPLLALLALLTTVLAVPAASADHVCIGINPTDGGCIVGAHVQPTSAYSWCASFLLNPPLPGAYTYVAGCTPNFCWYKEIQCPGEPPGGRQLNVQRQISPSL